MTGAPVLLAALGLGVDGVYAEYVITTADALVPVVRLLISRGYLHRSEPSLLQPEGVRPEVAAIASDAGLIAYNAVQHSRCTFTSTKQIYINITFVDRSSRGRRSSFLESADSVISHFNTRNTSVLRVRPSFAAFCLSIIY
jgi:hypothetical protein